MKPPVEHVRVGKKGRDTLIKLKRQTGIENWNVLCRWAFVTSLREKSKPAPVRTSGSESGVDMTWRVFAGEQSDIFAVLLQQRCEVDGFGDSVEDRSECLRSHLARGLDYLGSGNDTRTIAAFLSRWTNGR